MKYACRATKLEPPWPEELGTILDQQSQLVMMAGEKKTIDIYGVAAMPIADAFVSSEEGINTITASTRPLQDLDGVDVKSIDVVKLGQLHALLTGETFGDALIEFLPEVHSVSEDGPWVYKFPATLQITLAELSDLELSSTSEDWAKIPEFGLDGIDALRVASILQDLVKLAQRAEEKDEYLYLWTCL